MKCAEVMTKDPACCGPEDTAQHAAKLMKQEDVGPIPVVSDSNSRQLVGIVTDRDLVVKLMADGRDPKTERVSAVMTRNPMTCGPDDDLDRAVHMMAEHQVRRLPVVDATGRIVGIIAQADIATRSAKKEQTVELVREVSK
jgi:CBS domain-containing protein